MKTKAVNLFKYIKELSAQRIKVVSDVREQEWHKFKYEIPKDEENIIFNYLDEYDEDTDLETKADTILQVSKPEFERCPSLPAQLKDWVEEGWEDYKQDVVKKEQSIQHAKHEDIKINFIDDKERVEIYQEWIKERSLWVVRQQLIAATRSLFNELYTLYIDLDRDSETIELMVGQGVLECETEQGQTYHPLLLKRVALIFDSKNNILTITDTDANPEIYTMLLQEIEYLNHSAIKNLKRELDEHFYHPLDRETVPEFLTSLAHQLHFDSKYEKDFRRTNLLDKVIIFDNPVFFVRKQTGGVLKALEDIIEQISETGYLPGPILNLLGENVSQLAEDVEQLDFTENLAAISGEDKDILLTKEANKEQLQIAKRIENYNAVLVQGPPGTGKTHTIANLMGHFLAQGKSVLVTSYARKALTIVKEQVVPELQHLCVSVLDDNNRDMERTIDGITEHVSKNTSLQLADNARNLKREREKILEELTEVRKKLYAVKNKEYETITFGGKSYSVGEAASFIRENQDELSYIPGQVSLYKPLPVSSADLELLYQTNATISLKEEIELNKNLPNLDELITPFEFETLIENKDKSRLLLEGFKIELEGYLSIDLNSLTASKNGESLCNKFDLEKANELKSQLNKKLPFQLLGWQFDALLAGKKGGGYQNVWERLIFSIKDAFEFSGKIKPLIIGDYVEIPSDHVTEETIKTLEEMKAYLAENRKVSRLTLLFKKDWKILVSSIKINNQEISSAEDCHKVIQIINLKLKQNEIKKLWIELIEKNSGIAFSEFGYEPEQSCISFVSEIEKYLFWYSHTFSEIQKLSLECGLNESSLNYTVQYTDPTHEITYLLNFVYEIIPKYIDVAEIINIDLKNIYDILQENLLKIKKLNEQSDVCDKLLKALADENTELYRNEYQRLDELYTKYHHFEERSRILKSIGHYAPEWKKLIENRVGIHGENKLPEDIEQAWKWKQFAGIIEELTALPFEKLERKSAALNKKLRKSTAHLAENLAWYHLLTRVEADISQKQALQGWKQTTKKIGKGTGKYAPRYKREARQLMAKCQTAVPAWIMPINKALENLNPTKNRFDIVIIDEASQSDISSLAIMYLAKKIIIVGDDEQVSPSAVGINKEKMFNLSEMYIKNTIPNSHLYDMNSSLYDIAQTTFPTLLLKEHFRCVPSIIGYSNRLSYDYKIQPLRDASNVAIKPATISYRVDGQRDGNKSNLVEAKKIVALMVACMEQPEYQGMTFGVISLLGAEQAKLINRLTIERISPQDYEERRILCGNASHFQGDERDVIFISLVDNNEGEGPLRLRSEGRGNSTKQRYNVAVSRAKNQIWVIHSLDINNDLKSGDMRKDLIEYVMNPSDFEQQEARIKAKADSPFEISVANDLIKRGYNIEQQWPVGSYRIDMVAISGEKKIAIECDGELYHSGTDQVRADMERQVILERLGWQFIRIRGSEYYRDPEKTIDRIVQELTLYNIEPEQNIEISEREETELQQRVIARSEHLMDEWIELEKKEEYEKTSSYDKDNFKPFKEDNSNSTETNKQGIEQINFEDIVISSAKNDITPKQVSNIKTKQELTQIKSQHNT